MKQKLISITMEINSKGKRYMVTNHQDEWTCTCKGFEYREKCKHVDKVRNDMRPKLTKEILLKRVNV